MGQAFKIIDSNIKQQFLPFVIDYTSAMNKSGNGYMSSSPQFFTFRNSSDTSMATAKLHMCPASYYQYANEDISHRLLFNKNGQSVTVTDVLDSLPGIQIREYLPDTALDQCINFFADLLKNMANFFKTTTDSMTSNGNTKAKPQSNDDNIFKSILNTTWFAMKYITANDGVKPNILDAVKGKVNANDMWNDSNAKTTVLDFPYALYYRLQSCLTTNIYELPGIKEDRVLYSSNGNPGWEGDGLMGGFRLIDKNLGDGILGGIAKTLLGNIGISWTPWWDASKGNSTPEPDVTIKFDLFNDTAEAAMMNFIFVNTIIPNNKWIQYGLFQHSPHLYDIKLEGYNRLFACSAEFTVKQLGILRDPPPNWIHRLVYNHGNIDLKVGAFENAVLKHKLIKIPDIYSVEMKLKSLLPANFNNWIYTYVANKNHMLDTFAKSPYQESQMADIIKDASGNLIDGMSKAWDSGSSQNYVPEGMKLK